MLRFLVLYLALSLGANAAAAADLEALKAGDMRKLVVFEEPLPTPELPFVDETGTERSLNEFRGKVIVLNFWATWCAPCRKEMPQLAALQDAMGGDDLQVVTIATGRNPRPAMEAFLDEIGVENLPLHTDARQNLARSFGVLGLPVTIVLDREGQEIARLQGDADWTSESAQAILAAVLAE